MKYDDAMLVYGSDKPDLRVKLELTELTDVMTDVDFKVFSVPAKMKGGRVVALRIPGGAVMSRGEIDAYTEFVKIYGASAASCRFFTTGDCRPSRPLSTSFTLIHARPLAP